jgi:retron-type reverse transcriptase
MWRAWVDVATNQGAPGGDRRDHRVDHRRGTESVRAFLDGLAAELRSGSYRPKPLRRVNIPKPGKPEESRPLGIPTVRDRVVMAAPKIVLEPIFGASKLRPIVRFRSSWRRRRGAEAAFISLRLRGTTHRVVAPRCEKVSGVRRHAMGFSPGSVPLRRRLGEG